MKRTKRRDMKPGNVFRHDCMIYGVDEVVLQVVDAKNEVDIWTGTRWVIGDVMPGYDFEVLL